MTGSKTVEVATYDPGWPDAFWAVRDELVLVLGPTCAGIHHVGSTSVPGLSAKPVIDILVEAQDLELIEVATPALVDLGFDARGEHGISGRRYFSRPAGAGPKVHVHVFTTGHAQIERHLVFRDYLRAHPLDAARYGARKRALAEEHARDRDAYQAAKADFVERLHDRAFQWRWGGAPGGGGSAPTGS